MHIYVYIYTCVYTYMCRLFWVPAHLSRESARDARIPLAGDTSMSASGQSACQKRRSSE